MPALPADLLEKIETAAYGTDLRIEQNRWGVTEIRLSDEEEIARFYEDDGQLTIAFLINGMCEGQVTLKGGMVSTAMIITILEGYFN